MFSAVDSGDTVGDMIALNLVGRFSLYVGVGR